MRHRSFKLIFSLDASIYTSLMRSFCRSINQCATSKKLCQEPNEKCISRCQPEKISSEHMELFERTHSNDPLPGELYCMRPYGWLGIRRIRTRIAPSTIRLVESAKTSSVIVAQGNCSVTSFHGGRADQRAIHWNAVWFTWSISSRFSSTYCCHCNQTPIVTFAFSIIFSVSNSSIYI